MSAMRTSTPRILAALGAPAAALGTAAAFSRASPAFWLPVAVGGYALLIAACRALAESWGLDRTQAVVVGLLSAGWTVVGWIGGIVAVILVAAERCERERVTPEGAWAGAIIAGLVVYLVVSAWALATPRRLPFWILAPIAFLLCVLPVAVYSGICFD